MKQLLTALILMIGLKTTAQVLKTSPAFLPADIKRFMDSLATKQQLLISGSNIRTINGQTLLGPSDLSITAVAAPFADLYASFYTGNNGNGGTIQSKPKATLSAVDSFINASNLNTVTIGLQAGSVFYNENIPLTRARVAFKTYNFDVKPVMPKFVGTTTYNTGWTLTGSNTYQQSITHTISTGTGTSLGSYSYIYVIEVDTALEKLAPLTAKRYLHYAVSVAAVDTIAASYFCPVSNPSTSPTMISIHTSDGSSPNNNSKYRYDVVTRGGVVSTNGGVLSNGVTIDGIFAADYGQGVGAFGAINSGADSFNISNCIVMGNAIHQGVYGNWSIVNGCGFIGGDPNINGTSVVFYKDSAVNETNIVTGSIFIDNPYVLYTHVGTGGRHGKLIFKNSYILNAISPGKALSAANCDTLEVNNILSNGTNVLINSDANETFLKNSICTNSVTLDFHTKKFTMYNTLCRSSPAASRQLEPGFNTGDKFNIYNSMFHIKVTKPIGTEGGGIATSTDTSARTIAKNNIFIIDVGTNVNGDLFRCNTFGGIATGPDIYDYNVYIRVSGIPRWWVTNPATNGGATFINNNFSTWKTQSGQDSHSIFIDLTANPLGLKTIFVDPDNYNYNLTTSVQADSIRAVGVASGVGTCGMVTPVMSMSGTWSREQIYNMVETKSIPQVTRLFGKLE